MRLVSRYELNPEQAPKIAPFGQKKKGRNSSNIRSTLRIRKEGNIESRNCYCIRIDYDDDNEEVENVEEEEEEEEEEGEEEEEKVQDNQRQLSTWL